MSLVLPDDLGRLMMAARDDDDREAYHQLMESCHHMIRASILRETAIPDMADEIAQEVFVRGWLKREQFKSGTNPRAWLLAIARNQVMDYHRRQSRDNRHMYELVKRELLRRADQWGTDEVTFSREQSEALKDCMNTLDSEQRELLDLVHGQGLSTNDAASILELQPATCRKRLSRLQQSLRECVNRRMEGGK